MRERRLNRRGFTSLSSSTTRSALSIAFTPGANRDRHLDLVCGALMKCCVRWAEAIDTQVGDPNSKPLRVSRSGSIAIIRMSGCSTRNRATRRLATKVWPTTRSAERKRASIRVLLLPGTRCRAGRRTAGRGRRRKQSRHDGRTRTGRTDGRTDGHADNIMELGNVVTKWLQLCRFVVGALLCGRPLRSHYYI